MSKDISEELWTRFKGRAKEHWKELSDNEIEQTKGKRDQFVELIQERYVITKDEAEKQFDDFKDQCDAEAD